MEYLTKIEKNRLLAFLKTQIDKGQIDKEFSPHLSTINAMDDFCTTQCCTGHRRRGYPSEYHTGELRLRLSAPAMDLLKSNLLMLYRHRDILNVDVRYQPGRRWTYGDDPDGIYEEIMITFSGINRSKDAFDSSIRYIESVLRFLQDKLNRVTPKKEPPCPRHSSRDT